MSTLGPLDALPWLLGATASGLGLFNGLAKDPPGASYVVTLAWDKNAIRNIFAGKRFRARKNALTIIAWALGLAGGLVLGTARQFHDNFPVLVAAWILCALLNLVALIVFLRYKASLPGLRDREVWETFYLGGKWFKSGLGNAAETFRIALEKFGEQHPREHRRLARTLGVEFNASQRAAAQKIADHVEAVNRIPT